VSFHFSIKFAGSGGEGVISAGELTMRSVVACGLESSLHKSFASNLKGGHAISLVNISDAKITSPINDFDVLVSFDTDVYKNDSAFFKHGDVLIIDHNKEIDRELEEDLRSMRIDNAMHIYRVPFSQMAQECIGSYITKNMVVLGVTSRLFGIPAELYETQIRDKFKGKSEEITNINLLAFRTGHEWVKKNIEKKDSWRLPRIDTLGDREDKITVEGNQAIAMGVVAAGCKFFSTYPITPATSIGEYLAKELPPNDGFCYQAEDEIAALGAVIGASFSGVKAMTATSGPGLSLMQELLGLASMIELPLVVVDVQRGGPSTGMATKHDQGDLFSAAFGGHGEGQRIVLAATNVADNLHLTIEAFNLSERYQCPAILLSDTSLSMAIESIERPKLSKIKIIDRKVLTRYDVPEDIELPHRYKITDDGVSPVLIPGVSPATYTATSVEHDEDSSPKHSPEIRTKMMDKRFKKLQRIEEENKHLVEWDLGGLTDDEKASVAIISWGLSASIVKRSVEKLREKGYKIAALYPRLLYPLCAEAIEQIGSKSDILFVPEANYTGQLARLIQMHTGLKPVQFNISRGEPFFPDEIVDKVEVTLRQRGR